LARRVLLARLLLAGLALTGLSLTGAGLSLTRRRGLGARRGRRLRLADALVRLLAQPGGHAKRRNRACIYAAGHGNAVLLLKDSDGLAGIRSQKAVGFTAENAAFDQHALHDANIVGRKIDRRHAAAAAKATAEARAWTGRDHIDDAPVTVDEHDFILHDEEAVVAVGRERVDQRREGRNRYDRDARRHRHAGVDLEVDGIDVDARRVVGAQHRLLQRGLLLCGQVGTGLGLTGGRRLALCRRSGLALCGRGGLALGRRCGLALRHVLTGAGVRLGILRALTLRPRSTLVLACRLLGLLAIGLTLVLGPVLVLGSVLGSIVGSTRIVAVGPSLTHCLVLLVPLTLCAILATFALLFAGLLRLTGIVAVRPALARRLTLAAIARALGTAAVTHAGLIALRAAGVAIAHGGAFSPATLARFRAAALRHAFATGSSGSALRHSASGSRRHSLLAAGATAAAHPLRGGDAHAGKQRRRDKKTGLQSIHHLVLLLDCSLSTYEAPVVSTRSGQRPSGKNRVLPRSFRRRVERGKIR
jgi:hypothetical protein